MHDLLRLYSEPAARPASSADTAAWEDEDDAPLYRSIFRHRDLPSPPAELGTGGMYVRRGSHVSPSLEVDSVRFFAPPDAYRCLELWIAACLLEPGARESCLHLRWDAERWASLGDE